MCGIAGLFDARGRSSLEELTATAQRMGSTLRHRGPDDGGVWCDAEAGIALAHRRLAVLDLSAEGHQPMASSCGRYLVTFNGEIYNHRSLRATLERAGHGMRGSSDTAVLLAAVVEWGVRGALERFNGMFAFALWDRKAHALHLARDRLGEKPLYVGRAGGQLVFGSELKALRAHPAFSAAVDRGALALFLRLGYVPSPYSIYEGVQKLLPGTLLTVTAEDQGPLPPPEPYWSLADVVERGRDTPFAGSMSDATDELEALLLDAVSLRTVADVPLGAFLSGGIDSSTVVALMQAQSSAPVRTFTIAMPDAGLDESDDAAAVARHLGTSHTAVELTADHALGLVPRLPELYDEPFADPSQLPTLLVAEVARRDVTVSLSGDGGDEVFGGYNRHVLGRHARALRRFPKPLRAGAARLVQARTPTQWDAVFDRVSPLVPAGLRARNPGDKLGKLAGLLNADGGDAVYRSLVSQWADPGRLLPGTVEPPSMVTDASMQPLLDDPSERMMFLDTAVSLPDDMLTKVDRASMAVSLEARVPLLDHRVVELAWRLPLTAKIRGDVGKWVLREVLHRRVPRQLVSRPKMGFDPPVGSWLRGPLRPWAEELLDEKRLVAEGFFDPAPISQAWREHAAGTANMDYRLWAVLMFEAWLEVQ